MARTGERKIAYRALAGRPEGKSQLGRRRRRRDYDIKMVLQEVGWRSMDWLDLALDGGTCECVNEPSVSFKMREIS